MSARGKSYAWAIAGMVPVVAIAAAISDQVAGVVLIITAAVWNQVAAARAEHWAQAPKNAWRERRIMHLERQLRDAEALAKANADTVVVDLRFKGGQGSELARRVEAARERERLQAEPTAAEVAKAKADMVAAFEPFDTWGDPR